MESLVAQVNQVVERVRQMMNSKTPVHPEQYTAEGLKLAILKQKLGEMKSEYKRAQLVAEKRKYAEAKQEGLNATQTDTYIRQETADEKTAFLLVDTEHRDIGIIIEMIRSHASAIKEDK